MRSTRVRRIRLRPVDHGVSGGAGQALLWRECGHVVKHGIIAERGISARGFEQGQFTAQSVSAKIDAQALPQSRSALIGCFEIFQSLAG